MEIISVAEGSVGEKAGIIAGDRLISINDNPINDVLDYGFFSCESQLLVKILRNDKQIELKIEKSEYDDLGLECQTFLMDEKKHCKNRCIFCFIDQNPPGMRESIYFKDDDERLSFFHGNYITLTNLKDSDIARIIKMRISPINISVHTTDPDLRVKMMGNKRAGEVLEYLKTLANAGITMNAQLVLCRGINDGTHLERSLADLTRYPSITSIAVVPAGLTAHRAGLCHIQPYDKASAAAVVAITERHQGRVYASDEFYITAEMPLPTYKYYGEFEQLENGVGMMRLFINDFKRTLKGIKSAKTAHISIATGEIAHSFISALTQEFCKTFPNVRVDVYAIKNNFFGGSVTVSGLVTGGDILAQLDGKNLGHRLLIPANMLKHGEPLFLDDMSVSHLEAALGTKIIAIDGGDELCSRLSMIGEDI